MNTKSHTYNTSPITDSHTCTETHTNHSSQIAHTLSRCEKARAGRMGLQARTHCAGDRGFLKNSYIYLQQGFLKTPKHINTNLNTLKPILDKVHLCAHRFRD